MLNSGKSQIDRFGRKVYGPYLALSTSKRPGKSKVRRHVILLNPDGTRKNTSYARWLMEQHLGRQLTPAETVDHGDEDTLNDSISNFQIMSHAENWRKHVAIKKAAKNLIFTNFASGKCLAAEIRGRNEKAGETNSLSPFNEFSGGAA